MFKKALDKLPDHLRSGLQGEQLAEQHLLQQGMTLLERNFRCKMGEIDLIMQQGDELVFVEVRFRQHSQYGDPLETIDYRKQRKLIRSAQFYLQRHFDHCEPPCRFDVIAITDSNNPNINWIQGAFGA